MPATFIVKNTAVSTFSLYQIAFKPKHLKHQDKKYYSDINPSINQK